MKKTFCLIVLVLAGFGCSKKSETTANTNTQQFGFVNGACYDYSRSVYVANTSCSNSAAGIYTYNNGICYMTSTGQQVDASLCNTNSGYSYNNGVCYSTSTGQQVASSYCSGSAGSNGYVYNNGYCYSTTTGQYVDPSLCAGSGGNNPGGGYGQQCYGSYIYMQNGYQQQYVTCNGSNCRGYMLYQPSTGQQVYCQ